MNARDPNQINRLIGRFTDLQEQWESNPGAFDWSLLQGLAQEGAHAYNEGAGPSFHALAIDGAQHTMFHERFLAYSLQAGFDPFKLSRAGTETAEIPVIDHASLAEEAESNASSARMRATLMEIARSRFAPLAEEIRAGKPNSYPWLMRVVEACAESIPVDLLEEIAPELVRPHVTKPPGQEVDPVEGYLSTAEVIVDSSSKPYG
ncbi:MAG: hypothetical protein V7606_4242 [Burkholderiales bacterium]|jgi:hypothetical protein